MELALRVAALRSGEPRKAAAEKLVSMIANHFPVSDVHWPVLRFSNRHFLTRITYSCEVTELLERFGEPVRFTTQTGSPSVGGYFQAFVENIRG